LIQLNQATTQILQELCDQAELDTEHLLPLVYDELKRIAARELGRERPDHTLQPTALVHEAYMRMAQLQQIRWEDRQHFCGVAAHVIRRVLIDHERARQAAKRGGGADRLTLHEELTPRAGSSDYDLLAVNEALEELERLNPRHAQIAEMRFFAGFTIEETAGILGLSPATVKADWRMARAWLKSQLAPE
jgi:RNA polymerase sigma factor (TIGR02999 family)